MKVYWNMKTTAKRLRPSALCSTEANVANLFAAFASHRFNEAKLSTKEIESCIRVTVGNREQNDAFLFALKKIVSI